MALAVELAELKDMAHLDAAGDRERAACRSGWDRPPATLRMSDRLRIGQIAAPVHAAIVHILLVGAADEIGQMRRRMVHIEPAVEADRTR